MTWEELEDRVSRALDRGYAPYDGPPASTGERVKARMFGTIEHALREAIRDGANPKMVCKMRRLFKEELDRGIRELDQKFQN